MYLLYINIILFVLKSNDWRKCQQYKCLFLIYFFRGTRTIILSFILYLFMASHHNTPQKQIQVCTKPMIVFCPLFSEVYSCPVCQKLFSAQFFLKRHLLIHTGEKPFPCHYCDKSFNRKANLKRHMHTQHRK